MAASLQSMRPCSSAAGGAARLASQGSGSGSGSWARGGGGEGEGEGMGNCSVQCSSGFHTQGVQTRAHRWEGFALPGPALVRGAGAPLASGPPGGGRPWDAFERRLSVVASTTSSSSSSSSRNGSGMCSGVADDLEAQAAEAVRGRVERARQALAAARRGVGNTGGNGPRGGAHGTEAAGGGRSGRQAAGRDAGNDGGVESRTLGSVSLGERRGRDGGGGGSGAAAAGAVQGKNMAIGSVGGLVGALEGAAGRGGSARQPSQGTHAGQAADLEPGWWRAPAANAAAAAHGPASRTDTSVCVGRSTGPGGDEAADRVGLSGGPSADCAAAAEGAGAAADAAPAGAPEIGDTPEANAKAISSHDPPPLRTTTPSPSAADHPTLPQVAPSPGLAPAIRPGDTASPGAAAEQQPDTDALLHRLIATLSTLRDAELLLGEWGPAFRSPHAAALLARLPHLDTGPGAGEEGGGGANVGPRVRHLVRCVAC